MIRDRQLFWLASNFTSLGKLAYLCGRQIEKVKFVFYFYTSEVKDT
jgi:hypothetical protein